MRKSCKRTNKKLFELKKRIKKIGKKLYVKQKSHDG